jgi:hypothetical protein
MKKYIKIILIILLVILAWSPWLNSTEVNQVILQKVNTKWQGIMDGCGPLRAENIKNTTRIPFGYISSIQYACGFTTQEIAIKELNDWHTVYISPFGNVIGNY